MKPIHAYIGTYTTENYKKNRNANGVGIYVYDIDKNTGEWKLVQEMPALNPAVLSFGKNKEFIYSVNSNSCQVSAYSRNLENGKLTLINKAETDGNNVMILSVDYTG